jgi:hypothetical protein
VEEHGAQALGIEGARGIQGLFHSEVGVKLGFRKLRKAYPHGRSPLSHGARTAVHHRQGALEGDPSSAAGQKLGASLSEGARLTQQVFAIVGDLVPPNHQGRVRTVPAGRHGLGLCQGKALGALSRAFPDYRGFINLAVASFEGGVEAF